MSDTSTHTRAASTDLALAEDLVVVAAERSRRARDERGMTTAEYAVGTVAAASFAGVLIKVLTDPQVQQLLLNLLQTILKHFLKV